VPAFSTGCALWSPHSTTIRLETIAARREGNKIKYFDIATGREIAMANMANQAAMNAADNATSSSNNAADAAGTVVPAGTALAVVPSAHGAAVPLAVLGQSDVLTALDNLETEGFTGDLGLMDINGADEQLGRAQAQRVHVALLDGHGPRVGVHAGAEAVKEQWVAISDQDKDPAQKVARAARRKGDDHVDKESRGDCAVHRAERKDAGGIGHDGEPGGGVGRVVESADVR
jgi:hypothetical protein